MKRPYLLTSFVALVAAGFIATSLPAAASSAAPSSPTAVTAVPTKSALEVSWSPPVSPGTGTSLSYVVTLSPGAATCSVEAPATTCTVGHLVDGRSYRASVTATSSAGSSAPVTTGEYVVFGVPGPPRIRSVIYSDGTLKVAWAPPLHTGGTGITNYILDDSSQSVACTTATTTCSIVLPELGSIVTLSDSNQFFSSAPTQVSPLTRSVDLAYSSDTKVSLDAAQRHALSTVARDTIFYGLTSATVTSYVTSNAAKTVALALKRARVVAKELETMIGARASLHITTLYTRYPVSTIPHPSTPYVVVTATSSPTAS